MVCRADVDRAWPHRARLSRRCEGTPDPRNAWRRDTLAGAVDRADGGLHVRKFVDSRRADRRAPRACATDRNGTGGPDHSRRRAYSRAWDRPVAAGWGGPIRHLEIDLPRARLGIS